MKKHIYTIMMGTLGLFALSGCDSNVVATDEGQQQPILFSAGRKHRLLLPARGQ